MYQVVSNVSNDIECIKEYHGTSSVSRSKDYQEVSNIYKVYQIYLIVYQMYTSNEDICDILYFVFTNWILFMLLLQTINLCVVDLIIINCYAFLFLSEPNKIV